MKSDVNVVVLEDDFFSRNWMSLILSRDWRTRLVADIATLEEIQREILNPSTRIDVVIIDTEIYRDLKWIAGLLDQIRECSGGIKVLFTTVSPLPDIAYYMKHPSVRGYLTKGQIRFSLAWAAEFAADDNWVMTQEADDFLSRNYLDLPRPRFIMEGQDYLPGLSESQATAARLAFLFSLERAELADEMLISLGWSYGKVNELYELIGVKDLINGDMSIEDKLGSNPIIVSHFQEIMKSFADNQTQKARSMETLAFHLLTRPYIDEIPDVRG